MELPDIKQLDKLIALCRKRGVTVVKVGALELTLAEHFSPAPSRRKKAITPDLGNDAPVESDGWESLSDAEKLFWSVKTDPPESHGDES